MRSQLRLEAQVLLPLWPVVALLVVEHGWDLVTLPASSQPAFSLGDGTSDLAMEILLLGFVIGHLQGAREVLDGTIEFLDGLPTTRWRVFLAKLLVGIGFVALSTTVLGGVFSLVHLALGVDDVSGSVRSVGGLGLRTWATLMSVGLGGYGLGLLGAWVRGLGWAALLMGLFTLAVVVEFQPALAPLSPMHELAEVDLAAGRGQPAWVSLIYLSVGLAAAGVSAVFFRGMGAWLLQATGSRLVGLAAGASFSALLACTGLFSALALVVSPGELFPSTRTVVEGGRVFLYRTSDEAEALALVGRARTLEAAVRAELGGAEPAPVTVELMGGGANHAGRFTGGKIRMALDENADAVFAHELAHAVSWQLSDGGLRRHSEHIRFFGEGLARWVEHRVAPQDDDEPAALAGAMADRGMAGFAWLVEDRLRSDVFDQDQVYFLGHVFVEALVDVGGAEAPVCVLRQLGTVSPQADGLTLWQRLLDGCSLSLEQVVARYDQRLDEAPRDWAVFPELASVAVEGVPARRIYNLARGPMPSEVWCRFRPRSDTASDQRRATRMDSDFRCAVPMDGDYDISLGYGRYGTPGVLFDPWRAGG